MRKALIITLCAAVFIFAGCSIQVKMEIPAPGETETAAPSSPEPTVIPTPSASPSPTLEPTPSPTPSPTEEPTPHPTQNLSAIKGTWYNMGDAHLSIVFHTNGKADFNGSPAECTGYEFDADSMTGRVFLDDGGGTFPYDISIEGGRLHMLDDVYSRSPIEGTWYNSGDHDIYIVFHKNGTADFHGSPAECTGYEFDADSMTGRVFLDDGGGPYPYEISIEGGHLNMLGEIYTR